MKHSIPLLERLRLMGQLEWNPIGNEAADEIERLSAENSRLEDEWAKVSKQLIAQDAEGSTMRKTLKSIWAHQPGIDWERNYPQALGLITDAEVEAHYGRVSTEQCRHLDVACDEGVRICNDCGVCGV